MRRLVLVATVGATLIGGAVLAWATPPAGIAGGPIVARGTVAEPIVLGTPTTVTVRRTFRFRIRGRVFVRRVTVSVPSVQPLITCDAANPCDTAFQQLTINPQGHTGWHTHPGPTFVSVAAGEGTLYHGGATGACSNHKYGVDSGFVQPSTDVHLLRNEGSTPLTVFALYLLPRGTPNTAIRTDQPQPANCPNIPGAG